MDLEKVNAKLGEIAEENAAKQAQAEAEANKGFFERAIDSAGAFVQAVGEGAVMRAGYDRQVAERSTELAAGAVDFAQNTAADMYAAYNDLGAKRQEFLSRGAELAAQYSPENLQQAQASNDYSNQENAVSAVQDSAKDTVTATRNLLLSPVREAGREFINAYANDNNSALQDIAQGMEQSDANIEYFMTDSERMNKARSMSEATGIPTEAILSDNDTYKQALDIYNYRQKLEAVGGSIEDVWKEYPELQDIAAMGKDAAAVALHNIREVHSTRGIVDTFTHMLERGNIELEYNNIQYRIATGTADENDRKRAEDLKTKLENDKKKAPSFLDDPAAAIAAGIAGSAPEMWQSIITAADDAAIAASASMAAGALIGGSTTGGIGAAPGALLGGGAGFAGGFIRSLIANAGRRELIRAAAGSAARVGAFTGMAKPEIGSRYAEYGELTDSKGNPLLNDDQRRGYAFAGGALNAGIEVANLGLLTKQLKGLPYADKVFGDIIAETGARASAYEASKKLIADKVADTFKITLSESAEEGVQSIADDMVHNRIALDTGSDNMKLYSPEDMAARAMTSFLEAIPGSIGFGVAGAGGGMISGSYGISRAHRAQAKFMTDYGENAKQTLTGTIMLERLQQAVSENKMREKAPDVQKKILRSQLDGTGYENAYIDVEMALKKDSGMDDLKKLAKTANVSSEDLDAAIEQQGHLMIPTEVFSQASASPELLEAVSFSPEAESLARMKENSAATINEVKEKTEKTITRQIDIMNAIADEYYPIEKGNEESQKLHDMLIAAMYSNPENPSKGWKSFRDSERARLDEILAPALNALNEGRGGVGMIEVRDENDHASYKRFSENDPWYSDFYKKHKRPPTKPELEDMAVALVTGDPSAPEVLGWRPTTKEEAEGMAMTRAEIDQLRDNLETLDKIKDTAKGLSGVEMRLTEGLSKEGYKVYREVNNELKNIGGATARTARMNAVLFARHADIVADIISRKTGKKYTALDYKRERFAVRSGKMNSNLQADALYQPITSNINLEQQIPVINITNALPQKGFTNGENNHDLLNFVKELIDGNTKVSTADGYGLVSFLKKDKGHIVYSGKRIKSKIEGKQHFAAVKSIKQLLAAAIHVEEIQNKKLNKKPKVKSYHRFYIPVRIGDTIKTIRLVAEEQKGELSFNPKKVNLYDVIIENRNSRAANEDRLFEKTYSLGQTTRVSDTVSIREMLVGVKDYQGELYIKPEIDNKQLLNGRQQTLYQEQLNADETAAGFKKSLHDILTGKDTDKSKMVYVAKTPIAMQAVGAKDLPIYMRLSKIQKIVKDHPAMTEEVLAQIPKALTDPVFIFKSVTVKGRVVVVLDLLDSNKKHVVVPFELNVPKDGYSTEMTIMTSAYGKDSAKWFENNIKNRNTLYINKEKAVEFARTAGLQLPLGEKFNDLFKNNILEKADIVNTYGQETNSSINAQIETYADGKRVISIFETADESTFAHEMSHMFLMDLEDLAKIDETSAKELETVNSWAEWEQGAAAEYKGTPWAAEFSAREQQIIDSQRAGDHDTADKLKREWRQERFARAFELYLRDGKAPAKGLKEVFRKFKKFLRTIYIAFIGDGGKPSLQVQRIMDRMIATEDEIRAAELDDRYKDVTKAGGEKLFSETEEETYKRWYAEASEEAKEKLLAETMTELQGKKNEEFNNRLARERDRKEKELQQETVYLTERAVAAAGGNMNIALNWYDSLADFDKAMQETPGLDEALDSYMAEYTKALDAELIDAYLSEEAVNKAMDSTAARAKLENYKAAAFAAKQGLMKKIDHKAQYAMQSVEEHINSLPDDIELKLDKFTDKVVALTKALARLRTSTRWNSEDYNAIEKMVHAATKADLLESFKDFEAKQKEAAKADKENLKAVMKATEGRLKFFRETAQRSIQAKPLAEACNYKGYLREAKKNAGRVQAMIRAKRWDMAMRFQEYTALSNAMAAESKKMLDRVNKKLADVKRKLNVKSVKLPKDERYWLHHLAYILRIKSKDAPKPLSGVMSLDDLLKEMEEGLDIQYKPLDILHIAQENEDFRGWQTLDIGTFEDAVEALQMLYTAGKNKFNLLSNSVNGREIADIINEIKENTGMAANISHSRHQIEEDSGGLGYNETIAKIPGIGRLIAAAGQKGLATSMNIELILKIVSPKAHKYIYGIYERAAADEAARTAKEIGIMKNLLAPFSHKERREWKEQKYTIHTGRGAERITKENIICMALNLGNDGNIRRMIDGLFPDAPAGKFAENYASILNFLEENMTAKDWSLVQGIWDHLNEYWQETVAVEEKLNGVALKKIEAKPLTVKTNSGEEIRLKGGYYPVAFNPKKSSKAAEQDINKAMQTAMSGAQVLGTNRGFTQSRTEARVARPLLFEFGTIPEHLTNVIHNISYRIPARDVYRLINNLEFENLVTDTLGQDFHKLLKQWATDAWNMPKDSSNMASSVIERTFAAFRRNSVMSIMGYRIWPVIENISNIAAIMDKMGAVSGLKAVSSFYADYQNNKKLLRKSVFMQNRIESLDRDIRSQEGLFNADPLPFEIIRSHAYDLMLYSDLMLSMPAWVAVYKDCYAAKMAEVKRENQDKIDRLIAAQDNLNKIKGSIADNEKLINLVELHLDVREHGSPEEIAAEKASSPFALIGTNQLRSDVGEAASRNKELQKPLWDAEVEYEKATRVDILDDNGILEEAEWRAVAEADKAIRQTFGSGRTIDQSSIQRSRSEFTKLMTTFYSFFNTQFNAIYEQYLEGKFDPHRAASGTIKRWAPFAKSIMYRVVLTSLIGYALKFALGLEGDDDKDKYRKEKGADGKEQEVEVPKQEIFFKGLSKYILSTAAGGFVGVRDAANIALNYMFDGTAYGQSFNPSSTATRSLQEFSKTFDLLARKGEHNLKIDEQEQKREQDYQARLKKLTGKKREEAITKHEEDEKYRKPAQRITYSEALRHGAAAVSSMPGVGAAYTGLTSTVLDAVTGTMMYLNDSDNRYDKAWKNIIWSAVFDKKPVEREIPKRPAKAAASDK